MKLYVAYDRETEHDVYDALCDAVASEPGLQICGRSGRGPVVPRWQRNAEDGIATADQVVLPSDNERYMRPPVVKQPFPAGNHMLPLLCPDSPVRTIIRSKDDHGILKYA